MALRAVVSKPGVTARDFSGIEEGLTTTRLKKHDTRNSAHNGEEGDPKSRSPPRMLFAVIAEIGFVALGNLFLRSAWRGHCRRSVVKERHERMPRREHEQQKRNGHVHKQPAMQPMMQFCLKIEHPPFVAPRLNFFNAAAIRLRNPKFHKAERVVRIAAITQTKSFAASRAEIGQDLLLKKLDQRSFGFRIAGGRG